MFESGTGFRTENRDKVATCQDAQGVLWKCVGKDVSMSQLSVSG